MGKIKLVNNWEKLKKSKVFWTSTIGIVTAVAAYNLEEITLSALLNTVLMAVLAIFGRDALAALREEGEAQAPAEAPAKEDVVADPGDVQAE